MVVKGNGILVQCSYRNQLRITYLGIKNIEQGLHLIQCAKEVVSNSLVLVASVLHLLIGQVKEVLLEIKLLYNLISKQYLLIMVANHHRQSS